MGKNIWEEEIMQEKELQQNSSKWSKKKKVTLLTLGAIIAALLIFFVLIPQVKQHNKYVTAQEMFRQGKFDEAIEVYKSLGNYSDSSEKVRHTQYCKAKDLLKKEKYSEAEELFKTLGEYNDSKVQAKNSRILNIKFNLKKGSWWNAEKLFDGLEETDEILELKKESNYQKALYSYDNMNYEVSADLLFMNIEYKDSKGYAYRCGKAMRKKKKYRIAKDIFHKLGDYKDSKKLYSKSYMDLKYSKYKDIKLYSSEFTFVPKKEAEKYVKKFYGKWYDVSTGEKFNFGKYKRAGKEYGIRAVYVLDSPIIVYYEMDEPDVFYADMMPSTYDYDEKYGGYMEISGYDVDGKEVSESPSYTYTTLSKEKYDDIQERLEEERRRLEEQQRIEQERQAAEQLKNTLINKTMSAFKEQLDPSMSARDNGDGRVVELGNGVYTVYMTSYVHNLFKDFYGLHGTDYNIEATWQVDGNNCTLINLRY